MADAGDCWGGAEGLILWTLWTLWTKSSFSNCLRHTTLDRKFAILQNDLHPGREHPASVRIYILDIIPWDKNARASDRERKYRSHFQTIWFYSDVHCVPETGNGIKYQGLERVGISTKFIFFRIREIPRQRPPTGKVKDEE